MIQAHKRRVAITFSGGIDSTVLTYYFCEHQDDFKFLSPTPSPPDLKQDVVLIQMEIGESANFVVCLRNMNIHLGELRGRYGDRFNFDLVAIKVPMPSWSEKATDTIGYVPNRHGDNPNQKTFTELGDDVHIDGRNALIFTWLLSWCSKENTDTLITGHQYEIYEWDELDCYRARTEDVGPAFIDRMNLLSEVGFKKRVRIVAPWLDMRLNKYEIVKAGRQLNIDLENTTYSCYFYPECGKCGNCIIRKKALAIIAK
jgi:7-cyano-7-deazaguanine synthase in queuosine biosynthesis